MYTVRNLMEDKHGKCDIKRGVNRTIVVYPLNEDGTPRDNGPSPAFELYEDGVSLGIFDEVKFPLVYEKKVYSGSGVYITSKYTFFSLNGEIIDMNGADIPFDEGVTEEDHIKPLVGRGDTLFPGAFSIICVPPETVF